MNTPHERLIRTTFSLPLGEVHALVGGAVNARPLLFLHGFPDHPEDVRRYAAEKGLNEEEAIERGSNEKSREFVEKGADVYSKA
jgi:hypothetical protein